MKKLTAVLLSVLLIFSSLSGCESYQAAPVETVSETSAVTEPSEPSVEEPTPEDTSPPSAPEETQPFIPRELVRYNLQIPVTGNIPVRKEPINTLKISRKLPPAEAIGGIQPYSDYWFGNMAIPEDLANSIVLAYTQSFSDNTVFLDVPAGYDPIALLEWGKTPGLNVDILHKHGFTGKGAVIAYVDQAISDHPAYANMNLHYTSNTTEKDSMHGPSVLSMLAGKETGTAPEAEVYFYSHNASLLDQTTHAECLYQIIEQNKQLPEGEKITMVGFSDNPDPREKNIDAFQKAIRACEEAGIMVWFCEEYAVASFLPFSDRNNPANLVMDARYGTWKPQLVHVPGSGRTAANMNQSYTYWAEGGLSWTMPYVLGLYAIVAEIDPSLSQDDLRKMVVETAYDSNGMKLVNPVGFVAEALRKVGRTEEAQVLLDEAAARSRYLYAVMDTTAMNKEDLTSVSKYLGAMTDVTVLVVDAAFYDNAEALYTALQEDAAQRGGEVVGVQIFGTADMVPAFNVQYKVQMPHGVDDAGMFLTDLFYSRFDNDPEIISSGYNVMDHFAEGWNVNLIPKWPVARLPLSKGQFSKFFVKYNDFVNTTGLQRQNLVNFSNPIFASNHHIDDMGAFLNRIKEEFGMLNIPYRLYGNLLGEYPVTTNVLGEFTAENLAAENRAGIAEFIINSHGQWNNIDKCYFNGGKEIRESLINMDTINKVLSENPYYLDCWTCNNGYNMKQNLTTTALNGSCIGVFSATHIISNNGVNYNASITDMENSNFYYFYYHYLKAMDEGNTRSMAFLTAQQAYASALIASSANGIQSEGNYQFNLCNLLSYHNFGVLEPLYVSTSSVQTSAAEKPDIKQQVLPKRETVTINSITSEETEKNQIRFTIKFTAPKGWSILVFDPPDGNVIRIPLNNATGIEETRKIEIPKKKLKNVDMLMINFYLDDNNRTFAQLYPLAN